MKFNIKGSSPRLRKQKKLATNREWHTKYAWLPIVVDETKNNYNRVWLEKYWRKGYWGPSPAGESNPMQFTKYSAKEYFKKKLNGDFDEEKMDADVVSNVGYSSGTGALSVNKILKKGGPYDNTKYKRMMMTREPDDGTILSVDTKKEKEEDEIIMQDDSREKL